MLLINALFPFEEGVRNVALMKFNESEFNSVHGLVVVLDILFPQHKSSILQIRVSNAALPEKLVFILGLVEFNHSVSLSFKFFSDWDFFLKSSLSLLIVSLNIAKSYGIKALLDQSFSSQTLESRNQ